MAAYLIIKVNEKLQEAEEGEKMTPQMKHSSSQKDTTDAAACWEGQTCLSSITARTCPATARSETEPAAASPRRAEGLQHV